MYGYVWSLTPKFKTSNLEDVTERNIRFDNRTKLFQLFRFDIRLTEPNAHP